MEQQKSDLTEISNGGQHDQTTQSPQVSSLSSSDNPERTMTTTPAFSPAHQNTQGRHRSFVLKSFVLQPILRS